MPATMNLNDTLVCLDDAVRELRKVAPDPDDDRDASLDLGYALLTEAVRNGPTRLRQAIAMAFDPPPVADYWRESGQYAADASLAWRRAGVAVVSDHELRMWLFGWHDGLRAGQGEPPILGPSDQLQYPFTCDQDMIVYNDGQRAGREAAADAE